MATTDGDKDDLRGFFGWLLFLGLSTAAVIAAFLVFDASDDGAPDLVPTTTAAPGPADDVDLAAVRAALIAAGVENPTVEVSGPRSIAVGGDIVSDAARRAASDAARGVLPQGVNLFASFDLVEPEPEPEPAADEAAEPEVASFGSIDELAADLGMTPDDYGIDPDGRLVVRRGVWDTSAFTEFFGVEVIDYAPDERRLQARAILEAAGVENANVTFASLDPLALELHGTVPDGVDMADLAAQVEELAFVGDVVSSLQQPADPVVTFTVERGVVTLTGTVADEETRAAVIAAAASTFGAGNVVDELVVGPTGPGALRLEGDVAADLQPDVDAAMTELADTLGLELQNELTFVELDEEQAALQDELTSLASTIQINFASGAASLPADAPAQLDALVEALAAAPAGTLVAVEGHTDDTGDDASNQALSQQRAQSVVDYLVGAGVAEEQLRAVGQGESLPIADNSTEEGRAANRRIEFNVVV